MTGKRENSAVKSTVAGVVSGFADVVTSYPFDTVKVRLQTQGSMFNGAIDCFRKTAAKEGVRGLYRGMAAPLSVKMFETGVMFGVYEEMHALLGSTRPEDRGLPSVLLSGGVAGACVSVFLSPLELVKCKLQVQELVSDPRAKHSGVLQACRSIIEKEGMQGMFRGQASTTYREICGNMGWFATYEGMKYLLTPEGTSQKDLSSVWSAVAGGVAGVGFWTCMYPIDTVKSRVQLEEGPVGKGPSTLARMLSIARSEGIRGGLYRGYVTTIVRAVPNHACLFFAYDITLKTLDLFDI